MIHIILISINKFRGKMEFQVSGRRAYNENGGDHPYLILSTVDWIGHQLTHLFSEACAKAVRVTNPLRPGQYGQCKTAFLESAVRIKEFFLFLPFFGIGGALAIVGAPLRALASLSRKDFTFIRPKKTDVDVENPDLIKKEISILTFNTQLGPECMNTRNHTRSVKERQYEVAQAISKLDCDIVCLQETFNTEAEKVLEEELSKQGFKWIIRSVGHSSFKVSSGLFIASKFKLENPIFWENTHKGGSDQLSHKGVLAVTVEVSKRKFALFNLHLNAGGKGGGIVYRTPQMEALKEHVQEYSKVYGLDKNQVICGDFNIGPANDHGEPNKEWDKQKSFFDTYQTFIPATEDPRHLNPEDKTKILGTVFNFGYDAPGCEYTGWDLANLQQWGRKNSRIDHILVHKAFESLQIIEDGLEINPMDGSSDHLGVLGRFKIQD